VAGIIGVGFGLGIDDARDAWYFAFTADTFNQTLIDRLSDSVGLVDLQTCMLI
jgi:hypothetical protein